MVSESSEVASQSTSKLQFIAELWGTDAGTLASVLTTRVVKASNRTSSSVVGLSKEHALHCGTYTLDYFREAGRARECSCTGSAL